MRWIKKTDHIRSHLISAGSRVSLIVAVIFFSIVLLKTSPYRLLRPYEFFGARIGISSRTIAGTRLLLIPGEKTRDRIAFEIDQRPVTIRAYLDCVSAGKCSPPHYPGYFQKYIRNPFYRDFPVTYVSVSQARTYCAAQGGTIPTAAQWEDAAGAQLDSSRYPWGADPPTIQRANFDGLYQGLIPSGWLPAGASPFGVLDMAGNIREWVSDTVPNENPEWEDENLLKGGGSSDFPNQLEIGAWQVHSGASAGFNRGFRCVYAPPGPDDAAASLAGSEK